MYILHTSLHYFILFFVSFPTRILHQLPKNVQSEKIANKRKQAKKGKQMLINGKFSRKKKSREKIRTLEQEQDGCLLYINVIAIPNNTTNTAPKAA